MKKRKIILIGWTDNEWQKNLSKHNVEIEGILSFFSFNKKYLFIEKDTLKKVKITVEEI